MEPWGELVERKKKEIFNDCAEEIKKAFFPIDIKRAMDKASKRLKKVDALCELEGAVKTMLNIVGMTEADDG